MATRDLSSWLPELGPSEVQADGVPLPKRTAINFVGASASDDAGNDRVNVNAGGAGNAGKTTKAMANANQSLSATEAGKAFWKTTGTGHTAKRTLTITPPATEAESYTRTFLNSCVPSGTDPDAGTITLSVGTGATRDIEAGAKAIVEITPTGVNVIEDLPLDPRDFGCPWNGVDDDLPGLIALQQSIPGERTRTTRVALPKGEAWLSDNLEIFRRLAFVGHGHAVQTGLGTFLGRSVNGFKFPPLKGITVHGNVSSSLVPEAAGLGDASSTSFVGVTIAGQSAIVSDDTGNWGRSMSQMGTTYDTWEQLPASPNVVRKGSCVLKSGVAGAPVTVGSPTTEYYGDGHSRDTTHLVWFRCTVSGTKGSAKPSAMGSGSGTDLDDIGTTIAATGGTAQWVVEAIPKDYANGLTLGTVPGRRVFLPGDNAHVFECVDLNGATTTAAGESTTLHADMNGLALPQDPIRVASTAGFPSSGIIRVTTSTGFQYITYTGKTTSPATFTGCTVSAELKAPDGTMATGGAVSGPYRYASWGVPVALCNNHMFQPAHRAEFYDVGTTIAVASNGAALPQGTINVTSTAGFANSGNLKIWTGSAYTTVAYTGRTDTTFTGCTGGTGTLSTDSEVGQGCFWREIHSGAISILNSWFRFEGGQIIGTTGCAFWVSPTYKRTWSGGSHNFVIRDTYVSNCGMGFKVTSFNANGGTTENCQWDFLGGGRTNVDGPNHLNIVAAPVITNWASGRFGNAGDSITDRELGSNKHENHYSQFSGGQGYRNDLFVGGFAPGGNFSKWDQISHELSLLPVFVYPATVHHSAHGISKRSSATHFGPGSRQIRCDAPLRTNAAKTISSEHGPQSAEVAAAFQMKHVDDTKPVSWHPSEEILNWNSKWWLLGEGENRGAYITQCIAIPRPGAGATYPGGGGIGAASPPWLTQDYATFGLAPNAPPHALGFADSETGMGTLGDSFQAGSILFNRSSTARGTFGWTCDVSGTSGTPFKWHAVFRFPYLFPKQTTTATANQVIYDANTEGVDLALPDNTVTTVVDEVTVQKNATTEGGGITVKSTWARNAAGAPVQIGATAITYNLNGTTLDGTTVTHTANGNRIELKASPESADTLNWRVFRTQY